MISQIHSSGQYNVPVPPNRLLGRDQDLVAVQAMLADPQTRLVTLTGPGGVGKTHLALELAAACASQFTDGVAVIWLSPVRDPSLVLPTIARFLGLRETPGQIILDVIANALDTQDMLIVLDNIEHVVEAVPDIGVLIAATSRPRFLVTSRSPMRLRVEREYPVHPLPLPGADQEESADALSQNAAVQLFVERARAARPSFSFAEGNMSAIAEICRRLDGLPLAIELAAAMTPVLGPQALLGRMQRRLPLLVHGATDLPDRQRTLRGAIAWSHDLLNAAERALFRRLAVIGGSATFDAIASISPDDADILGTLTSLVNKSLLMRLEDQDLPASLDAEPRFRMLSTIREFAAECLDSSAETNDTYRRLLDWQIEYVATAESRLTGPEQVQWLRRLDLEHDNIRTILGWALDHATREGTVLASMMWRYWATRGQLTESLTWIRRFLDTGAGTGAERAKAYGSLGNTYIDLGNYPEAAEAFREALGLWEGMGDTQGIANTLNGLGLVEWYQGDNVSARHRHETALELRRQIGDRFGQGNSLTNLGNVIKDMGDALAAREYHLQALAVRQEIGDRNGVGYSYLNLADTGRRLGDPGYAGEMLRKSLDAFRDVGDRLGLGYAHHGLGMAEQLRGQDREAARQFVEGLAIRSSLGDQRGIVECIEGIAGVLASSGRHAGAVTLFGAADAIRARIGAPLPGPDQQMIDPEIDACRAVLSPEQFDSLWNEGAALMVQDATARALAEGQELADAPEPTTTANGATGSLSDREIEVVRLVAKGMTNAEVANELFLSRRTVDAHLRRIYDKLDLSSRSEVIRFALENDLS